MQQEHICVNIQSFTDVITNSSTEIYVRVSEHAIDLLYDIIDKLMDFSFKDSNIIGRTARDIFNISVDNSEFEERFGSHIFKYYRSNPELLFEKGALYNTEMIDEKINEMITKDEYINSDGLRSYINMNSWSGVDYYDAPLVITSKIEDNEAKEIAKLLNRLNGIFHCEACYNG